MDLKIIGIMSVLYAVARLLHYWVLTEEDAKNDGILVNIATCIIFVLWFLTFPVTIVFYFLNKLHMDRMVKIAKQEEWQDVNLKYDLTWKTSSSSSNRTYVCLAQDPSTAHEKSPQDKQDKKI